MSLLHDLALCLLCRATIMKPFKPPLLKNRPAAIPQQNGSGEPPRKKIRVSGEHEPVQRSANVPKENFRYPPSQFKLKKPEITIRERAAVEFIRPPVEATNQANEHSIESYYTVLW